MDLLLGLVVFWSNLLTFHQKRVSEPTNQGSQSQVPVSACVGATVLWWGSVVCFAGHQDNVQNISVLFYCC